MSTLEAKSVQLFKPNDSFDMQNERSWLPTLGGLPSDEKIVFTMGSLVRFLGSLQIEVGTNNKEIKNLPKFATFGKILPFDQSLLGAQPAPANVISASQNAVPTSTQIPSTSNHLTDSSPTQASITPNIADGPVRAVVLPSGETFVPTRKVREQPGGGSSQIASLFSEDTLDVEEIERARKERQLGFDPYRIYGNAGGDFGAGDAKIESKNGQVESVEAVQAQSPNVQSQGVETDTRVVIMPDGSRFIPSRKVRERPGGADSIEALFGSAH